MPRDPGRGLIPHVTGEPADVVIVGGGSAGCVLAARLSQDPARQVVLVEAGPLHVRHWPPPLLDAAVIPAGHAQTWQYTAELTGHREGPLYRGRVVGGSGAVNGGYFARAAPGDVDAWPGLSYAELLGSFVRSEHDTDFGGPGHGRGGPVPVTRRRDLHPISEDFLRAGLDAGFAEVADLNDGSGGHGVGRLPLNVRDGVRVNAALAYLGPALDRPNLRVIRGVATRLLVRDGRATGVRCVGSSVASRSDGAHPDVGAPTVILCAGAIESARLLLLSGIGPAGQLRRLGLDVHADLPVGQEFSDHPDVAVTPRAGAEPGFDRRSERTHHPPLEILLTTPTVELRPYAASFARLVPGSDAGPDPAVGVALVAPDSRGTLALRSTDPADAPRIAHHYLRSAADRRRLADGVRLAHDLHRQQPPADVEAWVGANLGTSQHMVGTCAMGRVVDAAFAVHGVAGLHVVDASVIPTVPTRGPHATVIALAEHAASVLGAGVR